MRAPLLARCARQTGTEAGATRIRTCAQFVDYVERAEMREGRRLSYTSRDAASG
jgi:hypothetical protein